MRVLFTGATGFIGSAVVKELIGTTLLDVMGGYIGSQKRLNAPLFVEEGADTETDGGAYQGTMEVFHGVAHHHAMDRSAHISRG